MKKYLLTLSSIALSFGMTHAADAALSVPASDGFAVTTDTVFGGGSVVAADPFSAMPVSSAGAMREFNLETEPLSAVETPVMTGVVAGFPAAVPASSEVPGVKPEDVVAVKKRKKGVSIADEAVIVGAAADAATAEGEAEVAQEADADAEPVADAETAEGEAEVAPEADADAEPVADAVPAEPDSEATSEVEAEAATATPEAEVAPEVAAIAKADAETSDAVVAD